MVSNTEPYVLSLAPAGGPALGGTSVTVLGVALEGVTRVRFGSHEVEPSSYLRRDGPAGPVTGLLVRAPEGGGFPTFSNVLQTLPPKGVATAFVAHLI